MTVASRERQRDGRPPSDAASAARDDRFAPALWTASLPIAVWVVHFSTMYAGIAAGCWAGMDRVTIGGLPLLSVLLIAISVPVVVWLSVVVAAGIGRWRRERATPGPLVGRLAGAGLSLVAVVWETVPVIFLPPCGP